MEEVVVTRLWMAGVVAAMLVFGLVALIGYMRQSDKQDAKDD